MGNSRQSTIRKVLNEMDYAEKYFNDLKMGPIIDFYKDMFINYDSFSYSGYDYSEIWDAMAKEYSQYDWDYASREKHIKDPLIKRTIKYKDYRYDIESGRVIYELYSNKGIRRSLEFSNDGIIKYDSDDYNASFDVDSNDFDLSIKTKYINGNKKSNDQVIVSYKNNKYSESINGIDIRENFNTGEYKAKIEIQNRKGKGAGMFVFEYSKETGVSAYFHSRKNNIIDLINEPIVMLDNENTLLAGLKRYMDDLSANAFSASNDTARIIIDEISKMEPGKSRENFINEYIRNTENKILTEVNNTRCNIPLNGLRDRLSLCAGYLKRLQKNEEIKDKYLKK